MIPLLWQTLRNYLKHDGASAFSGPLARGDVATVRKHLQELKKVPEAREVYVALARAAMKNLPVRNRKAVERELRRPTNCYNASYQPVNRCPIFSFLVRRYASECS